MLTPATSLKTLEFRVHGLHCADEIRAVRGVLEGRRGIADLQFDLVAERMLVRADPAFIDHDAIAAAIGDLGMRAETWQDAVGPDRQGRLQRLVALIAGGFLLTALAVHVTESGSLVHALLAPADKGADHPISGALFVLAAIAGLTATLPRAWVALRARRLDMNALVLVSVIGAALLDEWSEGATVASLFAAAQGLEAWSATRARQAVASLMRLTPHHAHVLQNGIECCLPIEHVHPGTVVLVRPGERVPVDGEVVSGLTSIDEAAISGESVPVPKRPGDRVLAGTINGSGALEVRALRHTTDSAITRMVRLVESARLRRTRTEQWIERFARYYTPAVLGAATVIAVLPPLLGLGGWTEWFYRGLVMTLIACPCALVISTPVTMVAALAAAARAGVLVKGGEILELLAITDVVAFDKTGVVTRGEPDVVLIEPVGPHTITDVLTRLAAIEARSEHPLGRAIVAFAARHGIRAGDAVGVRALPGRGAEGTVAGALFWIGSHRLADERHVDLMARTRIEELERSGLTVVLCGDATSLWCVIGIRDGLKTSTADTVADLRRLGVHRQVLLTGDSRMAADVVGRELGIDDVRAELLPEDKEAVVRELQSRHRTVVMVGDGVNDTPAMAAAAVGIALGAHSTDAALETADVVMPADDLQKISWVIGHAKRARRAVQQNVYFSIGIKAAFLILATMGQATLWMAIAADTGATFVVTLNGLRLLRGRGVPADPLTSSLKARAPSGCGHDHAVHHGDGHHRHDHHQVEAGAPYGARSDPR
jgi:Cd2+/Zn2+-exporting ATPase